MGSPRLRPALGWPTGGAEHRNTARAARVAARAWNMRRVGFAGSFGGRDHTPFPLYVALAAMFLPGRPVRLANDRFPQFQSGIKCHAFTMKSQIGVDRATGKIVAFADHLPFGQWRIRRGEPFRGDRLLPRR
jgi:CO/xanthine dehydrogenase Mo-binding subunit